MELHCLMCAEGFEPEEEIIVCPQYHAPYHYECSNYLIKCARVGCYRDFTEKKSLISFPSRSAYTSYMEGLESEIITIENETQKMVDKFNGGLIARLGMYSIIGLVTYSVTDSPTNGGLLFVIPSLVDLLTLYSRLSINQENGIEFMDDNGSSCDE